MEHLVIDVQIKEVPLYTDIVVQDIVCIAYACPQPCM